MRSGWGKDATWIEFACGPYFAKHDHLDTNQFAIFHKGHLAIDAGADYTDTESPHYLNYYRRTVAHNTLLVYQPGETFFWGENLWPAANDGGQRMDSSRFWNSVRSLEDWERTRDLWDRGRMEAYEAHPGAFTYARGNGTGSYQPSKMRRFVREMLWLERADERSVRLRRRAGGRAVVQESLAASRRERAGCRGERRAVARHRAGRHVWPGTPRSATFEEGGGRLRVHAVLPRAREVIVRGGSGWEFWTPGDEKGGGWGSGADWPLDPAQGGPLPSDPILRQMWKTFWGADLERLSPSNRRAVVPGAWRLEVSPATPARDDRFLHVLEIGDRGAPALHVERVYGHNLAGAVIEGQGGALFVTSPAPPAEAEATLPESRGADARPGGPRREPLVRGADDHELRAGLARRPRARSRERCGRGTPRPRRTAKRSHPPAADVGHEAWEVHEVYEVRSLEVGSRESAESRNGAIRCSPANARQSSFSV